MTKITMQPLAKKSIELLEKPLEGHLVKTVSKGSSKNLYIPSTYINDQLNRIFGFGQWSGEVTECRILHETTNVKLANGNPAFEVVAMARVKITISNGATYEDVNTHTVKMGLNSIGQAFDTAMKSAVSGAYTRASRHMGMQFGNVLYQLKSGEYVSEQGSANDATLVNINNDEDALIPQLEQTEQQALPAPKKEEQFLKENEVKELKKFIEFKGAEVSYIFEKMEIEDDSKITDRQRKIIIRGLNK